MIKRSGAIVLSVLYLVTAMGFALNLHFCCDQVTSVKINVPVKNGAMLSKCKSKCCSNKRLDIKVKDAHQGQSQLFLAKTFAPEAPRLLFAGFSLNTQQFLSGKFSYRGPPDPPLPDISTFLKNCTFRI